MYHLKPLILSFLSFFSLLIQGQELFPIQNFPPFVYQGETQNWNIGQTSDGNVYIANNSGLIEYNGASWKLYPSPNRTIMRAVNVQGNKIYTGCYMEFGYWEKDEFLNLKYTSLSARIKNKLLEDEQFWKIISYQRWVLFQSLHRIYIYDSQHDVFQIISSKTNLPKIFRAGNQIYFQIINKGVFQLENGKPTLVSDNQIFKKNIVVNIFLKDNKILIQTQDKGFFILEHGNISKWQTEATAKINTLSVYSSLQLRDGSFVLGTIGEGVYILSSDGKITMHFNKRNGLQNNTVLSLYEDGNSNIWLGLDNGISIINYASPFRVYTDITGNLGAVYAAACYEGFLYLGTNQGLFYRPLKSMDDFKIVDGTKGQVWTLKIINDDLFCGHNSGTFIIKNNKAVLISDIMGTWDIKPMNNNDNLLIQGNYEGLHILERKNGKWQYRNKIEGFDISSRYFELMPENNIFVSHEYKGVFKLNVTADFKKVTKINKEQGTRICISSGIVKFNQKLYYLGDSGFFEFNQQRHRFQKELFLNNLVLKEDSFLSGKLITDKNKTLWAFTEENLILLSNGRIDNNFEVTKVSLPLSLRGNIVGYECLLNLGNSNYLLGTTNGYILFSLDKIINKEYQIHINSIDYNKLKEAKVLIPLHTKKYKLKAKENNLNFSYNITNYERFIQTKYQYKLEGIYDNWSDWSIESMVSFRNLPSGEYIFKVRAKVGNILTSNISTFSFTISKPWYLSAWMIIVYLIFFIFILLLINHYYQKRYNEHKEKVDLEKRKELTLIQLKSEKEIFVLNNEKLNSEVEAVNRELASTTMAIIKKNELLNTLKSKLQQEKEIQSVKSALKIIDDNLENNTDWKSFQEAFDNTDRDFLKKLKSTHPTLTPNDLKLCVYLRLNLSSKEIAPMLSISPQSVEIKRFRLRKKLNLGHDQNLTEYILNV